MRLKADSSETAGFERILSYAMNEKKANFILGQWKDALVLHLSADGRPEEIRFGEYGVLKKNEIVSCIISYHDQMLKYYVDGKIKKAWGVGNLAFSEWAQSYPLVIGTDAYGRSGWKGTLYEVAIYARALTMQEISIVSSQQKKYVGAGVSTIIEQNGALQNCNNGSIDEAADAVRRKDGEPGEDRKPISHYLFVSENAYQIEHRGGNFTAIRDMGKGPAMDLVIPKYFVPFERVYLAWHPDWLMDRKDLMDVAVNIIGFIPLGFILMISLKSRVKSVMLAMLSALLMGCIISFCIEYLQAFLPSRDSSMRDLITNTSGTLIGCLSFWVFAGRRDRMSAAVRPR
jgi:VanZ family protein